MIENLYNQLVSNLNDLKIYQAKEYFDTDNIPDSLSDNSFIIKPFALETGEHIQTSTRLPGIVNLNAKIVVCYCKKLPVDKVNECLLNVNITQENIIKSFLKIETGGNYLDDLTFIGSNVPTIKGNYLIVELEFEANYRISNLI